MDFRFAVSDTPVPPPDFALVTVYHVKADHNYQVEAKHPNKKGYVLIRTIRGRGEIVTDGGGIMELYPESLITLKFSDLVRYGCQTDNWEFWWFQFLSERAPQNIVSGLLERPILPDESGLCVTAVTMLGLPDANRRSLAGAVFSQLYLQWYSEHPPGAGLLVGNTSVKPAIRYIHEHYTRTVRVRDLARLCNYSTRRFQDLFKEATGLPPVRYLNQIRIRAAMEYLTGTNLSLQEIAERTGFTNEYYFSRCFRGAVNCAPGTYRTKQRGPGSL